MLQKKYVLAGLFLFCSCFFLRGQQLKLGSNPTSLVKSALLELSSSNQGLLFPRLSDTTAINTLTPPDGMVIYFTPTSQLMLRYSGSWHSLATGSVSSGNAWSINGNTNGAQRILGTLDNFALPIYTANVERMRISNTGNVAIGATTFDGTNPEKLLINAGTTTSVNALYAKGSVNNYFQINIQNLASSSKASSDLVATANNGTETTNFVNLGINGSGWVINPNSAIGAGQANDCYLLGAGNDLYIANNNATKDIIFLSGGNQSDHEAMRLTAAGNLAVGVTTTTAKLDVAGTHKLGARGTIHKNEISFASTIPTTVTVGTATLIVLGLVFTPAVIDLNFNIPTTNLPTSTQATVAVGFGADLPTGVSVVSARVWLNSGVYQVRLRLQNTNTTTSGNFTTATPVYFTITEF